MRTRRESKAGGGLCFVTVHDGSCFDPIQVVARTGLAELRERGAPPHHRLLGGRHRHAGRVQGQGPGHGDPGRRGDRGGLGRRPGDVPDHAEAALVRVPARGRPPPTEDQHLRRRHPGPAQPVDGHPPLLRRAGLRLDPHADHHRQRRRGRRRHVPGLHAWTPVNGNDRLRRGLLRAGDPPHRLRPAQRRGLLPGHEPGVHVRPHVPGRELEHGPAPGGVLDGRARDRLRRPLRQRRPGRGVPEARGPGRARRAGRRHGVLRRAHRPRLHPADRSTGRVELRADGLHRRRRRPVPGRRRRRRLRVPGRVGHGPPVRARAVPHRAAGGPARGRHELPEGPSRRSTCG